ncbi:hypothetical protein LCGC14_0501140 [marine sediment metagenome]|uniref:Uncharacterized protein n=1 Tax=marine sediment metagenome TaxID=412755 RepID=A0A0F9S901_9ZZZZ
MTKIKNNERRELRRIAADLIAKLPNGQILTTYREYTMVLGSEVKKMVKGDFLPSGERLIDLKKYRVPISKTRPVNILKMIEKAFKHGGGAAVIDLVEKYLKPKESIFNKNLALDKQVKNLPKIESSEQNTQN